MFNWLAGLPMVFQILFSITVLVLVSIVLFFAIKRGFRVKAKGTTFSFGGFSKRDKSVSPHKDCVHNKDIIILLNESSKVIHQKLYLQHVQQMKDQMNFAEQKMDLIRSMVQKAYIQGLDEKGVQDMTASLSFSAYRSVLIEIQNCILKHFRYFFRENHFNDYSEIGFQSYIDNKVSFICAETTELMDRFYFYKKDIPREELYALNLKVIDKARPILIEIFTMARLIASEVQDKMDGCDTNLQNLLDSYI